MNIFNSNKIHFIGIGGIGISAIAKMMLAQGKNVSGFDLVASEITNELKKSGAQIKIGLERAKNLPDKTELVVYSQAVPQDNPELKKAKNLKIKTLSYPAILGELSRKKFTIAVAGMHGKTTTTALIGLILDKALLDPTVIVGSKIPAFGNSNLRLGKSKYLVIESDEYKRAFLKTSPKIIVLTRIDREHLDYYKDLEDIKNAFREYIRRLPKDGLLIANRDDKNVREVAKEVQVKKIFYSLKDKETEKVKKVLKIPGEHNISNALASLALAFELGIPSKITLDALSQYQGAWRRFERVGEYKGTIIISDYAHHPTEIKATIKAAREKYPGRRLVAVFQPHQRTRTKKLFYDFTRAFKEVDLLILSEIYEVAGRERRKDKNISSRDLARKIKNLKFKIQNYSKFKIQKVLYARDLPETKKLLLQNIKSNDLVLIMGAGDIDRVAREIV